MRLLLDTCAIIWAISAPRRLSRAARSALEDPAAEINYSPLSCAEVAWGVQRGRISIDRHWKLWFRHNVELNGWEGVPVELDIVEEAYSLPDPFHPDPVDRILVATARRRGMHLLTADSKILGYPHVPTIW